MQIGIPRESLAGETRVAATPNTVEQLKKLGFDVVVESGAGALASFDDAAYVAAGASVATSAEIWQADIIYKVNAPSDVEIGLIKEGATLVSFLWPAQNPELVAKLSTKKNQCAGDGHGAAYFTCAVVGCIVFDGQHWWLPCGD